MAACRNVRTRVGARANGSVAAWCGWLLVAHGAVLLAEGDAGAQEPMAVVWYRSTADCPGGAEFLARVEARDRRARLAGMGDRVDFVVTLSSGSDSESRGRLERQTSEGIVAIREVEGDTCEEVADALALGLVLALSKHSEAAVEPATGSAPVGASKSEPERTNSWGQASAHGGSPESAGPSPLPPGGPPAGAGNPDGEGAGVRPRRGVAWLGAAAIARTAVAPAGVWGGELHLEVGRATTPRLRLAAQALTGARATERGDLRASLLTSHLELCPLRIGRARFEVLWCGGLDLGRLAVSTQGMGGTRDAGSWAAITAQERLRWPVSRRLALEADLGFGFPLTPYRIVAEHPAVRLHRIDPLALGGGLGMSWRIR